MSKMGDKVFLKFSIVVGVKIWVEVTVMDFLKESSDYA